MMHKQLTHKVKNSIIAVWMGEMDEISYYLPFSSKVNSAKLVGVDDSHIWNFHPLLLSLAFWQRCFYYSNSAVVFGLGFSVFLFFVLVFYQLYLHFF